MKTAFAIALLGLAPIAADTVAPPRTAAMSVNRLIGESTEGRAANQRIEALRQKLAGDVAAKQKELQQDTTKPVEQRQADMVRLVQQSQTEFANAQRQAQSDFRVKLEPIVSQIASEQGLDLVLNGDNAVVWVAKRLDITDQVLAKLNAAPKQ